MSCLAILVNYHTSPLTVGAVESLLGDPACDQIYVVDNSLAAHEALYLENHLPKSVHLLVSSENLGFAGACNFIFAQTTSDFVLLLNPDARLLPLALERMLALAATSPRIGAVGPRIFWDEAQLFQLPPTTFPSAASLIANRISARFPSLLDLQSIWFRYHSLKQWMASEPIRVNALSGGHVLVRRSAVKASGGLFDPDFFMYWEDSDLMRRLGAHGFTLYLEPRAQCVHHYEHHPRKDALIADGWPAYARKYFSGRLWRTLNRVLAHLGHRSAVRSDWPVVELGVRDIQIAVPESLQAAWLIEFSPSPAFIPAMGRLGHGPVAEIPGGCAQHFSGQDFFIRLSDSRQINPPSMCWIARPVPQGDTCDLT